VLPFSGISMSNRIAQAGRHASLSMEGSMRELKLHDHKVHIYQYQSCHSLYTIFSPKIE
jgi:hypothetical protein